MSLIIILAPSRRAGHDFAERHNMLGSIVITASTVKLLDAQPIRSAPTIVEMPMGRLARGEWISRARETVTAKLRKARP